MAKVFVRALASISLILGAVAIFISVNGGTVRLRTLGLASPANEDEPAGFIISLQHGMPIGITLLMVAVVCFVSSRLMSRKAEGEDQETNPNRHV